MEPVREGEGGLRPCSISWQASALRILVSTRVGTVFNRKSGLSITCVCCAQTVRVQKLAVFLTALLRRWVEGDEEGFKVTHSNLNP